MVAENGNGHSNGNGHHREDGGIGGAVELGRNRQRQSLQLIQRAVRNGWRIKDEWLDAVPEAVMKIMSESGDERNRLRAAQLIEDIVHRSAEAAVALDKIERLDAGDPTERTETREFKMDFDRAG